MVVVWVRKLPSFDECATQDGRDYNIGSDRIAVADVLSAAIKNVVVTNPLVWLWLTFSRRAATARCQ